MIKGENMKKLLSVTAAVIASLLAGLQAQEAEEAPNLDAPVAAPAKTDVQAPAAEEADAKGKKAENRDNPFAEQQKKIDTQMTRLKKAKKSSERRKIRDVITREQHNLEVMLNRKLKPYQDKVSPLKERIRISTKNTRPRLERELADLEAEISRIKKEADLEKWGKKIDIDDSSGNVPNPGPGKKAKSRRSKKKK